MTDRFSKFKSTLESPAENAENITPNDSTELTTASRAIYIGTSGNLTVDLVGGSANIVFTSLPVGWHPIRAIKIKNTGTTATNIVTIW